jgi:hypothetical protein
VSVPLVLVSLGASRGMVGMARAKAGSEGNTFGPRADRKEESSRSRKQTSFTWLIRRSSIVWSTSQTQTMDLLTAGYNIDPSPKIFKSLVSAIGVEMIVGGDPL